MIKWGECQVHLCSFHKKNQASMITILFTLVEHDSITNVGEQS